MIKSDSVEAQRSTYYKPMCLLKSSFLHVIIKTPPSNKKIHQSIRAARVSLHVKKSWVDFNYETNFNQQKRQQK